MQDIALRTVAPNTEFGNQVAASFGYSAQRLQLTSLKYTKGANTLFNTTYGYSQGGGNNGQITKVTDLVDNGRTVDYTYDALARLKTAVTVGSAGYAKWGLSWTYDRYGNRTNQTVTHGTAPANSLSISATTNRITSGGFSYDASGNLTNDALNTYTYDAESRIKTVNGSGATYSYDGASQRVKKVVGGTTTRYIFSGTKVIAEYVNGALSKEYIYSGSKLLVTLTGSTPTYHHADRLTTRLTTENDGGLSNEQGHYPFGEGWYAAGKADPSVLRKFTSFQKDSETGSAQQHNATFRQQAARLGRFMTPDLLAGSIFNPQSLNRYAYTRNDPINLVDPLGLESCERGTEDCVCNDIGDCHKIDPVRTTVEVNESYPEDFSYWLPGGAGGGGGRGVDLFVIEVTQIEQGDGRGLPGGVPGIGVGGQPCPPPRNCAAEVNAFLVGCSAIGSGTAFGVTLVCTFACIAAGPGLPACVVACVEAGGAAAGVTTAACGLAALGFLAACENDNRRRRNCRNR